MNLNAQELALYIKDCPKNNDVKAYVYCHNILIDGVKSFLGENFTLLIGDYFIIKEYLDNLDIDECDIVYEIIMRNSAVPLLNTMNVNARIEPGSYIREHVVIEDNVVVMMGAIINIGAIIKESTMIDMNAVVGARAIVGKRVHVGAGSVIAGVLEPVSKTPVIIEDDVLIGANAVILEGVRVGQNSIVAAGAIVINDVPPNTVVAGSPARIIKDSNDVAIDKKSIVKDLRG